MWQPRWHFICGIELWPAWKLVTPPPPHITQLPTTPTPIVLASFLHAGDSCCGVWREGTLCNQRECTYHRDCGDTFKLCSLVYYGWWRQCVCRNRPAYTKVMIINTKQFILPTSISLIHNDFQSCCIEWNDLIMLHFTRLHKQETNSTCPVFVLSPMLSGVWNH